MKIYENCLKRVMDFSLSLIAIIVFSPLLIILSIVGLIAMKGNPFFCQPRPGKKDLKTNQEKIFKLIKFRTMSNAKDKEGNLLPDNVRLNSYGKFLRSTSLDELPELLNILKGDMSIIGPRPLLVEYLPWYSLEERHRHDIRPGLTGWAQVNGRNCVEWDKRFKLDVEYVDNISFELDIKIFFMTIKQVLCKSGVAENTNIIEGNFVTFRKRQKKNGGM